MSENNDKVDIRHKIGVDTPSPDDVYTALTTVEGRSD